MDSEHELIQPIEPIEPKERYHKLDPNFVRCEQIQGAISVAVIGGLGGLVFAGLWLFRGLDWVGLASLGGVLILLLLTCFFSFIWPNIYFRSVCWGLDENRLEIRQGVFWKQWISVPLGRVQHADVSQGPIQRQLGLGKLKVYTAGTFQAFVELDGLNHHEALLLRDKLIQQTQQSETNR